MKITKCIEKQQDTQTKLIHYGGNAFTGSLDMIFDREENKDKIKLVDDITKNK